MSISRLTVVTDLTTGPPDMGERVVARALVGALRTLTDVDLVDVRPSSWASKTMLDADVIGRVRARDADAVLYMPASSLTFASSLRAGLLGVLAEKPVTVLTLQPRDFGGLAGVATRALRHVSVLTTSRASAAKLPSSVRTGVLPPAIDLERFAPVGKAAMPAGMEGLLGRPIVLHVGHISASRGLDALTALASDPGINVVVVGSSSTLENAEVGARLRAAGVHVITSYVECIADLYRAAAVYVFPVENDQGCIDTPMSVLEALASGVPVVSTHFGSLPEILPESDAIRFVDSPSAIPDVAAQVIRAKPSGARALVEHMTWENAARVALAFVSSREAGA